MGIALNLRSEVRPLLEGEVTLGELSLLGEALLEELSPSGNSELSLLITGDREIAELNRRYRGVDSSTDVLSFPQGALPGSYGDEPQLLVGDVVISVEKALFQARNLGHSLADELLRLLIHGTLHLFDYDHEGVSPAELREMEEMEERLYERLCPLLS